MTLTSDREEAEFTRLVKKEIEDAARIVKAAGIKPE